MELWWFLSIVCDIIRSTEFRLYLRIFTFIWILFQFLISIDREHQYDYDKSRTYMMHLPFFFPFWFAEKFCLLKGNLSIIVCFGWQTPKRFDTGWNREWTRLVKKAEDWYHMDCKWQTLKLLAKFIKNLKLWRSSFNVFFLKQVKCEKQILTGELYFDKWHFGKVEEKSLKNFRLLRDLNPRLVSAHWLRNPTGLHSHMLRARKNISGSLKQVTLSSFFLYRCFYSFFFF